MNTEQSSLAHRRVRRYCSVATRPRSSSPRPALGGQGIPPGLQLAQIVGRLSHGIVITDASGKIVYCNASAQTILGAGSTELLSCSIVDTLVAAGYDLSGDEAFKTASRRDGQFTIQLESQGVERRALELKVALLSQSSDGINGELYELRDVSVAQQRTRQLIYEATHDPLTGLANRRALSERLSQTLQWEPEPGAESVLAILDLDGFKRVNDSCGHLAGDAVLCDIAGILQANTRKADIVARLGGDEFVLLLVGSGRREATKILQAVCDDISEYRYQHASGEHRVTASVGGVLLDAGIEEVSQALQRADEACYRAKSDGGERVMFFRQAETSAAGGQVVERCGGAPEDPHSSRDGRLGRTRDIRRDVPRVA